MDHDKLSVPRALGYIRTAAQGPDLAWRRIAIETYAGRHAMHLLEVCTDDGLSGLTLDRPGLRRLLDRCRRGAIDVVVVTHVDRLSRSVCEQIALHREFEAAGIALHDVRHGRLEIMQTKVSGSAGARGVIRHEAFLRRVH